LGQRPINAHILPALKGGGFLHLFGVTSVIWGAVGRIRAPPILLSVILLMEDRTL
jgi:hypothetical protein